MIALLTVLHVVFCLFLILVILLQTGKGAGMGVAFGGASQTVFGPRGAGSFIGKATAIVAALFMVTSLLLAWTSSSQSTGIADKAGALAEKRSSEVEEVDLGASEPAEPEATESKEPEPAAAVADGGAATTADAGAPPEPPEEIVSTPPPAAPSASEKPPAGDTGTAAP